MLVKPVLITGDPGCGKSYLLKKIIEHCVHDGLKVIIAHPTAKQARTFINDIPLSADGQDIAEVKSDTVHSIFRLSIDSNERVINWSLVRYDVLIVDEIAKVDIPVVNHIFDHLKFLPVAPVLIMAGDPCQQRPMGNDNALGNSIFESPTLKNQVDVLRLYHQCRITCTSLSKHLSVLRCAYPSNEALDFFNSLSWASHDKISGRTEESEEIVWKAFTTYPETIFLTITKDAAQWINTTIVCRLFSNHSPVLLNITIADNQCMNLYTGMRLMITENQCKQLNIVNGAVVTLKEVRHGNLIVTQNDGSHSFISKSYHDDSSYYPVLPYYAGTIYKAQGETLEHATIWLDIGIKSPGTAYTAFSRVKCHQQLRLLEQVRRHQLCPVQGVSTE